MAPARERPAKLAPARRTLIPLFRLTFVPRFVPGQVRHYLLRRDCVMLLTASRPVDEAAALNRNSASSRADNRMMNANTGGAIMGMGNNSRKKETKKPKKESPKNGGEGIQEIAMDLGGAVEFWLRLCVLVVKNRRLTMFSGNPQNPTFEGGDSPILFR